MIVALATRGLYSNPFSIGSGGLNSGTAATAAAGQGVMATIEPVFQATATVEVTDELRGELEES